jgi:sec-independent protein translocase protein TatB
MLDLSWSHILVVLIVALAVVGPKDLPRVMRTAGQWLGKAREMAGIFRQNFNELARQAELDELRKEIQNMRIEQRVDNIGGANASQPAGPEIAVSSTSGKSVP